MKKTTARMTGASLLAIAFLISCAGSPAPAPSAAARPDWVSSPYSIYSPQEYVAVVGVGRNRALAESDALANLAVRFGVTTESELRINEIAVGIAAEWAHETHIDRTIAQDATMFLVGAEIRDSWHDGANYHVSAVMNRARTAQIYTDLIRANLSTIDSLVNMPPAERNSITGFARYTLAAAAADANMSYANVLSVVGAPAVPGVRPGNEYRLSAAGIAAGIPVMVVVDNPAADQGGRIHGAFARAVSETGLRTVSSGAQYTLQVGLNLSDASLPGQQNVFVRYEISANLVNSSTGLSQVPVFNINGREGHVNMAQAENRAIAAAERRIASEYGDLLAANLLRALPGR